MRLLFTFAALLLIAADSQAGPLRNRTASRHAPVQSNAAPSGDLATRGSVNWQTPDNIPVYDGLDELNAIRRQHGQPPYIRDPQLTQAAGRCALVRAVYRIRGHLTDERSAPGGASAVVTGCGAVEPSWGFLTCAMHENRQYAGAAIVYGGDGRRYMHLFVR